MPDAFTEKKLNWDSEGQPLIDRQRLLCDVLFSTRSCSSRTMRDKSCSTGTLETTFHYVVASKESSSNRTQKGKSSSTESTGDASVTNQSPCCFLYTISWFLFADVQKEHAQLLHRSSVGGEANLIGCMLALKVLLSVAGHILFGSSGLRKDINGKKRFLSGIARMRGGGGVYPCPNFLALFQEEHFW